MPYDLPEAKIKWREIRQLGTQIEQLINKAQVAFIKADGTSQAPHADTIADIKAQFAVLAPQMQAAWNDYKTALNQ
jgi:hypothetical protein